jgi:hypothetical protein
LSAFTNFSLSSSSFSIFVSISIFVLNFYNSKIFIILSSSLICKYIYI